MERAAIHEHNHRQRFHAAQETRELLELLHGDYSNLSRLAQLYVRIVLPEAAQAADAVAAIETRTSLQLRRELNSRVQQKRKTTKSDFENLQGRKKNTNDEHN